ncbi:MAG: Uma2 family endonuclease [Bryobacterales bacterium]|nr:Uma2 family endonuclease [Bryobacterales bacterium]
MRRPPVLVPVEEYLRTSFEGPDREYVDGVVVERHVGEKSHSRMQRKLVALFAQMEPTARTYCFPEQRLQVAPTRFRVPDLCVYLEREPEEEIFTTPPFLVVEILSPCDRHSEVMEKISDYLRFGVPWIWVIDPRAPRGWIYTADGGREAPDGILRTENPTLAAPLAELVA